MCSPIELHTDRSARSPAGKRPAWEQEPEEAAAWCEWSSCALRHILIIEWLVLRTKSFYSPKNILASISGPFLTEIVWMYSQIPRDGNALLCNDMCAGSLMILLIFRPIPTQNELVV